jgi:tRNA(fMet)-specific endonuclease VapC
LTCYLLDTNIRSDLVRNPPGRIAEQIARVGENAVCTSIIVAAELRFGTAASAVLDAAEAQSKGLVQEVCPVDLPFDAWFSDRLTVLRQRPRQVMRAFKAIALSARTADRANADLRETEHFAEV